MGVTSIHPHRCTCAYCQQRHGWRSEPIILDLKVWEWLYAQGEPSDVIEQLVKRAGAA